MAVVVVVVGLFYHSGPMGLLLFVGIGVNALSAGVVGPMQHENKG